MTASLLDVKFILLMLLIGLLRPVCSRYYVLFGACSSAALIGFASPPTLLVTVSITLALLYPLHALTQFFDRSGSPQIARMLLPMGIGILVCLLCFFKLHRYFSLPWLSGAWLHQDLVALVGFSYFIFKAINFLHIQSILNLQERTPWPLLFYTLFPPTITSGPIQKYQDFRMQIKTPLPLSATLLTQAGYRVTRGYFRKLAVAYVLNGFIEKLLTIIAPNVITSLLTVCLLYLYFYYDFAGYSDIAIGFGLILGLRVPENFRQPFLATSVSEFWRHWHITLVDWFRDHVFIPLGGMRSSRWRTAILAFTIMLLCGFWHGLTLSFLAWGLWHGSMLFIEAISGSSPLPPSKRHGPRYWGRLLWTNSRVAFACVFFLPNADIMLRVLHGFINWKIT